MYVYFWQTLWTGFWLYNAKSNRCGGVRYIWPSLLLLLCYIDVLVTFPLMFLHEEMHTWKVGLTLMFPLIYRIDIIRFSSSISTCFDLWCSALYKAKKKKCINQTYKTVALMQRNRPHCTQTDTHTELRTFFWWFINGDLKRVLNWRVYQIIFYISLILVVFRWNCQHLHWR